MGGWVHNRIEFHFTKERMSDVFVSIDQVVRYLAFVQPTFALVVLLFLSFLVLVLASCAFAYRIFSNVLFLILLLFCDIQVYGGKLVRSKGLDGLLGQRGVDVVEHNKAVQVQYSSIGRAAPVDRSFWSPYRSLASWWNCFRRLIRGFIHAEKALGPGRVDQWITITITSLYGR